MGNQSSSLHQAAAHNDIHEVEKLFLQHNANVNDRDKVRDTASLLWLELKRAYLYRLK